MKKTHYRFPALILLIISLIGLSSCTQGTIKSAADKKGLIFGTAVTPGDLLTPKAAELLTANFNVIVPENIMKLQYLRPTKTFWNWSDIDAMTAFAANNKMKVRGHTFVWHQQNPPFISGLSTREAALEVMTETITETMKRYAGKIYEYDVCNEVLNEDGTLRETVWSRTLGPEYIDIAFQTARKADPTAKLVLNDYNNEYEGTAKADGFYNLVKDMVARGIPIDGVGMQLHLVAEQPVNETALRANMQRFRELGLYTVFTEVDVRIQTPTSPEKEAEQEAVYLKLMEIALSEKDAGRFVVWGYTDKQSWIPGTFHGYGLATLFDKDVKPKPVYTKLTDMIKAKK